MNEIYRRWHRRDIGVSCVFSLCIPYDLIMEKWKKREKLVDTEVIIKKERYKNINNPALHLRGYLRLPLFLILFDIFLFPFYITFKYRFSLFSLSLSLVLFEKRKPFFYCVLLQALLSLLSTFNYYVSYSQKK